MKTDLTTYGSFLQTRNRPKEAAVAATQGKSDLKVIDPKLLPETPSPDYKVELSKPAGTPPVPALPTPDLPTVNLDKPKLPEATEKPQLRRPDIEVDSDIKEGTLKKPVVIFIKGLDIFSSPSSSESGYAGVGKMAESIPGARIYGWDQHKEIIKEIKKVQVDQPVVLVGHSFGGDTAHEVAEALDSLEHGFRRVDLLVTIDAIGASHDIIPQNVKNHLNVFGEKSYFLNDGPHVARRPEMTKVKNILSPLDHTELDDDKEIQYEVVTLIKETLSKNA